MPLLNDAKTCYVGTQPITTIMAGGVKVWPKSCVHTDGRPSPLPPANNGSGRICTMTYRDGGIQIGWSNDFPNVSQYSAYQVELYDAPSCEWVNVGRTTSQAFSSYQVPKEEVNSFQTYDGRVTGVFSADGSLDEAMYRYSTNFVTIPDRRPPAPSFVLLSANASVMTATYDRGTSDAVSTISKHVGELRKVGAAEWILPKEAAANVSSISWTQDELEPAAQYQARISTFNQWGQGPWTVSDPATSP